MNKRQRFSGLVGTVIALGFINTASAGHQSWHYDASSDTVSYAFSGSDNRNSWDRVYPETRQAGVQSWQYDNSSDTIIYAVSGNRQSSSEQSADTGTSIAMDIDLPRYYYD
ncbi:MAG: hypothetical protein WCH04_12990 [Gammaproteobacteria bacterium]